MKIIFICSSLEPRKDGVGDYTRRLAAEMQLRKIEVLIIAICDKFITLPIIEEKQNFDNLSINTLRYRQNKITAINWDAIRIRIDAFAPNIISFQFVIYGYHPKGLPYGLPTKLNSLFKGYETHIMFHELWVGMEDGASLKHMVYGFLQKNIIKNLLKTISPKSITTHTLLYKWQLKHLGYEVSYLPLFSNIKNLGIGNRSTAECNIVLFGGMYPCKMILDTIMKYSNYSKVKKLKLNFIFLGRNGLLMESWINMLEQVGVSYVIYGERSEMEISQILNSAHIGIATTPRVLEGKSGVVQAYKEHDLKVEFVNDKWTVSSFSNIEPNTIPMNTFELFLDIINNNIQTDFDVSDVN